MTDLPPFETSGFEVNPVGTLQVLRERVELLERTVEGLRNELGLVQGELSFCRGLSQYYKDIAEGSVTVTVAGGGGSGDRKEKGSGGYPGRGVVEWIKASL